MFYICNITEKLGEYEFGSTFLMESKFIETDFYKLCRTYRGQDEADDGVADDTIWSGDIALDVGDCHYKEITKEEFDVMKKHLSVLR